LAELGAKDDDAEEAEEEDDEDVAGEEGELNDGAAPLALDAAKATHLGKGVALTAAIHAGWSSVSSKQIPVLVKRHRLELQKEDWEPPGRVPSKLGLLERLTSAIEREVREAGMGPLKPQEVSLLFGQASKTMN
jgi:hypothetical protein